MARISRGQVSCLDSYLDALQLLLWQGRPSSGLTQGPAFYSKSVLGPGFGNYGVAGAAKAIRRKDSTRKDYCVQTEERSRRQRKS